MLSFQVQWRDVAFHGVALSVGFMAAVLLSYWLEPLAWATDFPEEVQERIGPVPERATYVGLGVFFCILVLLLGGPMVLGRKLRRASDAQARFPSVFTHVFLVLMIVNAWDFLVIDILVFDVVSPDFMMIDEAKDWLLETVTVAFHFRAFLIGIPIMIGMALLSAGISLALFRRPA